MDKGQIASLVNFALSCYPMNQDKDPLKIAEAWSIMLADMPYELAGYAVKKCIAQSKYFPSVAEIRDAATTKLPEIPTAEAAWEEVRKKIGSGSTLINLQYNRIKPEWSHKLIERAVEAIGLWELLNSENQSYDRTQFLKFYESFKQHEVSNRRDGFLLQGEQKMIEGETE
jgi:hypothetical protein